MLYIAFNYYTISLLLGAFTALISGFVVIVHDYKRQENQAWFALTMCTAIWSSGYFYMTVATTYEQGMLGNWILHYAAILIPLIYYVLVLIITNTLQSHKPKIVIYSIIAFFFTTINLSPLFVSSVIPKVGFNYAPVPGSFYIFFFIFFVVLVMDGLITTFRALRTAKDKPTRARFWYTIIFTIAASVGGGSVFATTFLNVIPPLPLILFSIYPAISGYAILRYQLFDVKVVSAQILTFALWIFIFVRVLLSSSFQDQVLNSVLLVITIVLGLLLIRSVVKEVESREKIELLAKDLEKVNARLTDLDRQKSEFVSFATHQLRGPLAAMKGYASLLLEGDMGELGPEARNGVSRIYDSTNTLVAIVNDYLNISRIELGAMKYAFETIDLKNLIEDVVAELKPNIDKTGVKFSFVADNSCLDYRMTADRDKLKQVIANIIDNSLKYTPSGSIDTKLYLDKVRHLFIFTVKDTGVGIAKEVLPHLFQKFSRAENASKTNIRGTGLGLYVAKEMVEAHHGTIRAESDGEGKGSTFTVELEPFSKA
jgi:signal transduction histidine kinase